MWLQLLRPGAHEKMPDGTLFDHLGRAFAWASLFFAAVYIGSGADIVKFLGGLFWTLSAISVFMSVGGHERDNIKRAYSGSTT